MWRIWLILSLPDRRLTLIKTCQMRLSSFYISCWREWKKVSYEKWIKRKHQHEVSAYFSFWLFLLSISDFKANRWPPRPNYRWRTFVRLENGTNFKRFLFTNRPDLFVVKKYVGEAGAPNLVFLRRKLSCPDFFFECFEKNSIFMYFFDFFNNLQRISPHFLPISPTGPKMRCCWHIERSWSKIYTHKLEHRLSAANSRPIGRYYSAIPIKNQYTLFAPDWKYFEAKIGHKVCLCVGSIWFCNGNERNGE